MIWTVSTPKCYICGYSGFETSGKLLEKPKWTLSGYRGDHLRNRSGQRKKIFSLQWKHRPLKSFQTVRSLGTYLFFCTMFYLMDHSRCPHSSPFSVYIYVTYLPLTYMQTNKYINVFTGTDHHIVPVIFWWNSLETEHFTKLFSA